MAALLLHALRLVLRVGLDLGFGERQWAQLFFGEGLGLVHGVFRVRITGFGERQYAYRLGPFVVEADDLQIAGAADDFAFAVGAGYGLHGVVDPQFLRAAMDRGLAGDLDVAPCAVGAQAEFGDLGGGRQHRFAQGFGDGGAVDGQATWGGERLGRVEGDAPGVGDFLQVLHQVDEVHQANAAVEAGALVPVFQAGAQRLQRGGVGAEVFGAEREQVGHDLARQVHLVVHHHVLQVGDSDRFIQGLQAF